MTQSTDSRSWADYSASLRAILDEYARATRDFETVLLNLPDGAYTATTALSDKEFPAIANIAEHVIGAAHNYAHYIEDAIEGVDRGYQKHQYDFGTPTHAMASLWEAFGHMVEVLGRIKDWNDEQQEAVHFVTRWKQTYDIEQLLEHAIVHILRHRRQLERWRGEL